MFILMVKAYYENSVKNIYHQVIIKSPLIEKFKTNEDQNTL